MSGRPRRVRAAASVPFSPDDHDPRPVAAAVARRHALFITYFALVDRPADGHEARATALAAFLDDPASRAPSGRLDALVDLGNPMKGTALFPFLQRRVEGRALAGCGPHALVELSRTAGEEGSRPARWPHEVCGHQKTLACLISLN